MTDTGPSDAGRTAEIRRALARLRDELEAAGVDVSDPRARSLISAFLAEGTEPHEGARRSSLSAPVKAVMALEMRVSGESYRAIARALGWKSHNAARKAVQRALATSTELLDDPIEMRTLLVERCEAMWAGLAPKATKGDAVAVRAAVRVFGELRHYVPGLDVLRPDDEGGASSGAIHVTFNIPAWEKDEPVPQAALGEIIEASARTSLPAGS